MNFGLSNEQELLQRSARELLAKECPPAMVRDAAAAPATDAYPRALYKKLAALGWFAVFVPETHGGSGGSMLDAALLCEEAGRAALPGPFLSIAVLAPLALARGGSAAQKKAWLERLTTGDAIGAVAIVEADERYGPDGIGARVQRVRDGYRLSGTKLFVLDAEVADFIVVAARHASGPTGTRPRRANGGAGAAKGVSLFLVERGTPGLAVRPLESIDATRRFGEVILRDVVVPRTALVGREGEGWPLVARLLDAGAIAVAADCLGGAERVLEMSVEYAKIREQFGRPIGSFQAVKHMAAEMVGEIEPARSLVWYAAHAYDARPREAARAASAAKARLGEVFVRAANRAVQIHGGVGFTWEHDLHWWFTRATWNQAAFGDTLHHLDRLARIDAI
jgi:alkylation response protein AidB-like acyl-CoA dehydrogenase